MRIFRKQKPSDITCYNCGREFRHDAVKWAERTISKESMIALANKHQSDPVGVRDTLNEIEDKLLSVGSSINGELASPNAIFGHYEYEYVGTCFNCRTGLRVFWFGKKSLFRWKRINFTYYPELQQILDDLSDSILYQDMLNQLHAKVERNYDKNCGFIIPRPFNCHGCKNEIRREFQCWYSTYRVEGKSTVEIMTTMCHNCGAQNGYPFDYNLNTGIIE